MPIECQTALYSVPFRSVPSKSSQSSDEMGERAGTLYTTRKLPTNQKAGKHLSRALPMTRLQD